MIKFIKVKIPNKTLGVFLFDLIHPETGQSVPFYLDYLKKIAMEQVKDRKKAQNSIDAYAKDLKKFLEYVYNAQKVFFEEQLDTESTLLSDIIISYPSYLTLAQRSPLLLAKKTARVLAIKPVKASTANRQLSTINSFLNASASKHAIVKSIKSDGFINIDKAAFDIHESLNKKKGISQSKRIRMLENSVIAQVISGGPRYTSTKAFRIKSCAIENNFEDKNFPIEYIKPLLQNAKTYRDRAMWALQAGAGLRMSEVSQVLIQDLDIVNEKVKILSYQDRVECFDGIAFEDTAKLSFKGRKCEEATFIAPFDQIFFESVVNYLKYERPKGLGHDYLFVTNGNNSRGKPLFTSSASTLAYPMKQALKRINCPPKNSEGASYSPHSLRHFYGFWLINFAVTDDGERFTLLEVRDLMGHRNIKSTQKYAVADRKLAIKKIRSANKLIRATTTDAMGAIDQLIKIKTSLEVELFI
ncbi:tyrosine-type recombinase/integrase [Paraferrimonas haliotis]|uniref:tyrosine-type recombinase/integrase n=1 Tax=Paraferrimonas haliotis TaxID=2013866 RepID=UPI000BA953CA|nr:tyrosine-type recombinase/integrase [Paraferrimonas haliotis]